MKNEEHKIFKPAIICFIVLSVICGIIYPLAVTGIGQLFFRNQANGSIITVTLKDGTKAAAGSALLAQEFTKPEYMLGRAWNNGSPSNLSPVSGEQKALVEQRIARWRELDPSNTADIPQDLLTVSGSGIDPQISPAAAEYQVSRIARERSMSEEDVRSIIKKNTDKRFLGFIGEERVNVLKVNLTLDGLI